MTIGTSGRTSRMNMPSIMVIITIIITRTINNGQIDQKDFGKLLLVYWFYGA